MTIVIALGGNALLRRGDPMTTEVQRGNIRIAARTGRRAATALLADIAGIVARMASMNIVTQES